MDPIYALKTIDPATFDKIFRKYADLVPEKLLRLDKTRYITIPESLNNQPDSPSLSKDDVATLVDWKLSHGKFRPSLKGLVQQNPESVVEDTTRNAFEAYNASSKATKQSLDILTKLRGVGPATASLLLSVYAPETVPFFSDELFRWCLFEDAKGKGGGWDREIKYNLKEYLELFDRVQELRQRFEKQFERRLAAIDVEKVAYVLARKAVGSEDVGKAEDASKKRKAEQPLKGEVGDSTLTIGEAESAAAVDDKAAAKRAKKQKMIEAKGTKKLKSETAAATRPRRKAK